MRKTSTVCLLAMLCCLLWGSAFPCIKIGYQMYEIASGDAASQIVFAGVRFFFAGILTLLFGSVMQKRMLVPGKKELPMILQLAGLQTVAQYFFFYLGLAHTSGVKSSIISGANTFFAILIASLCFHMEKLSVKKVAGCLIGFAGVVLINLNGSGLGGGFHWNGELFILLSTLSAAFSSVHIKRCGQKANPVLLSGCQFCVGGLVLFVAGKLMGGELGWHGVPAAMLLLYMAGISSVAYTIWALLLKYNPVSRIGVFGLMNPMFGVLLSAILLKEKGQAFSLQGLISLILVCIGIYIVNREDSSMER